MSLKRALWRFFVIVFFVSLTIFVFPHRTTADSAVRVLNKSDKSQFGWIANGSSWFSPNQEIVPTRIVIKRLNIDVKIKRGGWQNNSWKISDDDAFFAPQINQTSTRANSIFIYGHNTENLFKPTTDLKIDDELIIKLDSGPWVKYKYVSSRIVHSNDVSALSQSKSNLILLACYGSNNEMRRLMYFKLEN